MLDQGIVVATSCYERTKEMGDLVRFRCRRMVVWTFAAVLVLGAVEPKARAGGGPANVLVLFNADSGDASDLAHYYAQQRAIPANRLCGLSGIDPGSRSISFDDYVLQIHDPLVACIQGVPQPDDIDYIVIVRGLPYRVDLPDGGYRTSLSAMIQVLDARSTTDGTALAGQPQVMSGSHFAASVRNPVYLQANAQPGDFTVENQYSGWYQAATGIVRSSVQPHSFRSSDEHLSGQWDLTGNLFVVTRLDGFDFQDARALVDRAVQSDGSFPTAEILCMAGSDSARGARDPECEFATRYLSAAGFNALYLESFDGSLSGHDVAAYLTGTANLRDAIAGNSYVPGAITGNLTSTGAAPGNFFCNEDGTVCPASESQTSIARFVRAGATGSHGTVAEPLNNVFPNAGALLLYTFGYNLGESYFFNQRYIYWVNLYLGDPLASPYAERPQVEIGPADLPLGEAITVDATHPAGIAELRIYVDGTRVARGFGEHLEYRPDGLSVGDRFSLLAVALANNQIETRPGWPQEVQSPQPDIQGWASQEVTMVEARPHDAGVDAGGGDGGLQDGEALVDGEGPGRDGGGQGDGGDSGCGCRSDSNGGLGWAILLILVLVMLRRGRSRRWS